MTAQLTAPSPSGTAPTPAPLEPADARAGWLLRWSVPVTVLLVGWALFPRYRHGIALDGLSYLSIAQSYADGRWADAINAYWSPLLSWVHVPLLVLGVDPLDAATVLAPLIAAGVLIALGRLLRACRVSLHSAWLVSLVTAPLVLAWAHLGVFADLLLTGLLLAALAELVDSRFARARAVALRAGLLLGAAYLAKLYALPFTAALLPLLLVLHHRVGRIPGRQVLQAGGLTLAGFALVALPWVAALSADAGRLTVGTAATHNLELVSPGSTGNPIFTGGLLPPERPGAYSTWEDPSTLPVDADGWGADRGSDRSRVIGNVRRNVAAGATALVDEGGALLLSGVLGTVLLARARRLRLITLGGIGAAAIYAGGYAVTWVEPRYMWFLLLLLAVPTGHLLDRLARTAGGLAAALAGAGLLLVLVLPSALDQLALRWDSGRELDAILGEVDDGDLVEPGMIVASVDNWQRSAILCFRLDCTYVGIPASEDPRAELADAGVERVLVWSDEGSPPAPLPRLAEVRDTLQVFAAPR